MGAGRSGLFNGTKGGKTTVESNAQRMSGKYPLTQHGYFGSPGKNSGVRVIYSRNPIETAKDFYTNISVGGKIDILNGGKLKICRLSDGTIITYREVSKSKSPAVDINISAPQNIKEQKIHFEEKK
ncbi:MAG: hypothetical protein NC332_01775 [Firmicutes bacterium]|nr:hypothetical protein [Bacillota bacterium]